MITRRPFPGCWYGEACLRPDGAHGWWTSPIGEAKVRTERGAIATDEPLLFTRGHPSGKFAGQVATAATGNKLYEETGGPGLIVGDGYGENTVLFLRDGTLVQGAPHYGSQGLRYQADDGSIITGDQSHLSPDGLLADYTELHHIRIGADQIAGLGAIVQVLDRPGGTGPRYILEPGDCYFIRFNFSPPDQLAVYVVKLQERQAVAFWLTVADLHTLPPYPVTPAAPVVIGPTTPSRSADGRLYDLAPFFQGNPAWQPRVGLTGRPDDTQQSVVLPGHLIVYNKFGTPGANELYGFDDNWARLHLADESGPGVGMYFTDPRWWPRRLAIGEAHAFITGPHEAVYYDRATCRELRREPFNRKMWLVALHDAFQWGRDLGVQPTIILAYDGTAGIHGPDRVIELWYVPLHADWSRWEAYQSQLVYAHGLHGGATFSDATIARRPDGTPVRSDFYLVGGPPRAIPALSGCVPAVCPHLPAWSPTPAPRPTPTPTPKPPMSQNTNPSYDEFINGPSSEAAQVRAAYLRHSGGHEPAISDYYHNAWRRLRERWTLRDILHDILGEPLEDGGAGGADRGPL